jgi:hypothetical protein
MIDTERTWDGVPGIQIETDLLRLAVIPQAGAKIHELVHRPSGFDLLWRNPRVPLRPTYPGPSFDDVWSGGWDELFPTDEACTVGDSTFHDHGDLWHGPWEWEITRDTGDRAEIHLSRDTVALPCRMEKWIGVERGSRTIGFRHRLTNLGHQPVEFDWSLHVAHAIGPDSRVHMAPDGLHAEPGQAGRFAAAPDAVGWPMQGEVDVGAVQPPESGLLEWLYPRGLREGWCAVAHPSRGVGLGLEFDPEVFRTVWTWGVYGGWRGHYVLLTEPSTSPPGGLARSVANGTAARLEAHGVLETEVRAVVLEGIDGTTPSDRRPGRW